MAPLLRVLLNEPDLVRGYASAYAVLLRQDAAGWQARQRRRLVYLLALASDVLLALLFTGIALMAVSGYRERALAVVERPCGAPDVDARCGLASLACPAGTFAFSARA